MPGLSFDEQIEKTIKLGCGSSTWRSASSARIDTQNNTNELIKVVAPANFKVKSGAKLPLANTLCSLTFEREEPLAIHDMGNSEYKSTPVMDSPDWNPTSAHRSG